MHKRLGDCDMIGCPICNASTGGLLDIKMTAPKVREFEQLWLCKSCWTALTEEVTECPECCSHPASDENGGLHHVIEYAAFEQQAARIKELEAANANCISLLLHESRMRALEAKIDHCHKSNKQKSDDALMQMMRIAELEAEKKEYEADCAHVHECDTARIKELEAEKKSSDAALAEVLARLTTTMGHWDDAKAKISSAETKIKELEAEVNKMQDEIKRDYSLSSGIAWKENQKLSSANKMLEVMGEALKYYGDEGNWYDVNRDKVGAPVLRMVIGSIDTTGNNWIGGYSARQALAQYEAWQKLNK